MVRLPPTSTLFPSPPPFRSCPAASASPAGLAPPRGACVRARLGPASLGRGRERVRRAGGRRRSPHAAGCDPRGCRRLRVLPAGPAAKATTPPPPRKAGVVALAAGAKTGEHTSEIQSPCKLVCRLLP